MMSCSNRRRRTACSALVALALVTGAAWHPHTQAIASPSRDALPPLPSRAIVLAVDISASVPLTLAESTRRLVIRSLRHAYAGDMLASGVPNTLIEWVAIGIDSYSPQAILLRAWIPGVHAQPANGFVSRHLRDKIAGIIGDERKATLAALRAVIRQLDGLRFQTQYGTDLEGAPLRAALDTAYVNGPTTILMATDLLGAPPESDGVTWQLPRTDAMVFEYCSQSTVDTPQSCLRRRHLWDEAFHHAGASTAWYSATNLDTLPFVAFMGGLQP